jgi:hypothetical protein
VEKILADAKAQDSENNGVPIAPSYINSQNMDDDGGESSPS